MREVFWLHKTRRVKHFFHYTVWENRNVSRHVWMCKSMIFETSEGKWNFQLVTHYSNCTHKAIVWLQKSWKVHRSWNMDYFTVLFLSCLKLDSITLQFHQEQSGYLAKYLLLWTDLHHIDIFINNLNVVLLYCLFSLVNILVQSIWCNFALWWGCFVLLLVHSSYLFFYFHLFSSCLQLV